MKVANTRKILGVNYFNNLQVDRMDDAANKAYGALPQRLYIRWVYDYEVRQLFQ